MPPDVIFTTSRPDLVMIDKSCSPHQVTMIELAMTLKQLETERRQEFLATDVETKGFKYMNRPLEIGVRGYLSPRNRETLFSISQLCKVKRPKDFIKKIGKTAILGSYVARKSQEWSPGGLIIP